MKQHGLRNTKAYASWNQMRQRCHNSNNPTFKYYGACGIRVCERWNNFRNFYADMGDQPEGCQLDRIDNDGNYEASNCRWADRKTQARNKRTRRVVEVRGVRLSLAEWCELLELPYDTVSRRLCHGWGDEQSILTPISEWRSGNVRASPLGVTFA